MVPPLNDAPDYESLIQDDLLQHDDDGSLLGIVDDESHESRQQKSELSRDIEEMLYEDDSHNTDDDDEDLLTYYLRKREMGFNAMVDVEGADIVVGDADDDDKDMGFNRMVHSHDDSPMEIVEEVDNVVISDADDDYEVQGDVAEDDQMISQDEEDTDDEEKSRKKKTKAKKDNVYNHRPHQNRTGVLWEGWPDKARASDAHWWRKSKMCFEVDHICHRRSTNTWFYYQPQAEDNESPPFQPSMQLRCEPLRYDRGLIAEERVNITVDASSKVEDVTFIDDHRFHFSSTPNNQKETCKISPIPIHMTLQSMFNFMIGEFYARTLLPLYLLMTSKDRSTNSIDDVSSPRPWEQDIQFYVHLSHGDQTLYDGHKLLLSGMLSGENSADVKSITDLFFADESAENANREYDECKCFEKMVFCGYDVYMETNGGEQKSNDNEAESAADSEADSTASNVSADVNTPYTLWSGSQTCDDLDRKGYCGKSEIAMDLYSCDDWADLRYFISSNFNKHYPLLAEDVRRHRKETLIKMNFIDDSYSGDTKEWKFVGLTQRSYRRSWINLPSIMNECNAISQSSENPKKVACVEVNVEETTTPYEQLLLHQAVDALIGVHGAQMTQGVLLPPHSHILELLPWMTDYIRGWWVQTRHTPTPLGIIFHNTDLNHLGYSLGRDSVPLCEGVGDIGSVEEKECFIGKGNRGKFIWESRDFKVKAEVIMQFIHQFLLTSPADCSTMKNALDKGFVQYNVWCLPKKELPDDRISPINAKLRLRHYYDGDAYENLRKIKRKKKKKKKDEVEEEFN
eukprot:scaffold80668_cov79-Cyclotella_meneghiniana.AAC.2